VRELLTTADPNYGQAFTEADWNRIAERLSALARLLWRISQRQVGQEPGPGSTSVLPAKRKPSKRPA
jgi:hypothetical protein